MADREAGRSPTVASALWIVVAADRQREGLSARLVGALREAAARAGLRALIAPVQPTLKARYPLIPMDEYAAWTDASGAPFDPWLRVHWRLGGTIAGVCSRSMTIEGSVEEWEGWCGMAMPASGRYVVDGGLAPVDVDRDADVGTYVEPNVWVRHDLT